MNFLKNIQKLKIIQVPVSLSKKIVLPGFDGLPLYDVLKFFVEGCMESSLTIRASALSFRFFLALFPLLLFLFSLIPYIPIANLQDYFILILGKIFPQSISEVIQDTVLDIINNKRHGILSFSFITTLYFSMNGVNALLMSFNNSHHLKTFKSNIIKQYLTALGLLFILITLVILVLIFIVFGEYLIDLLITQNLIGSYLKPIITVFKYLIILIFYFLGISSIYYLGNIKSNKFRFISAGSTFTTIISIVLSLGFAFYVNHFGSYNKLYGSIGALIIILMWIYLNALVLLIGFELNASIHHAKRMR